MRFSGTRTYGWTSALVGMRLPMCKNYEEALSKTDSYEFEGKIVIGENDMKVAKNLIKADHNTKINGCGSPNSKFLQMVECWFAIEAPLAFWKEFDTYRHMVKNSTSTMHRIQSYEITDECFEKNPFTNEISPLVHLDELESMRLHYLETKDKKTWYDLIYGLGDSWLQTRMCHCNYETLRNMVTWRRNHKQNCWSGLDNPNMDNMMKWISTLPYSDELLMG